MAMGLRYLNIKGKYGACLTGSDPWMAQWQYKTGISQILYFSCNEWPYFYTLAAMSEKISNEDSQQRQITNRVFS